MHSITWHDALIRFAEDRLITGREFASLFVGIGVEPSEHLEPNQIVEAMFIDELPIVAARLASKVDGTRTETEYVLLALDLREVVHDHQLLNGEEPLPDFIRKAAVGMGTCADAAANLIRGRMMAPLVPIRNTPEEIAEWDAFMAEELARDANQPKPGRDQGSLRTDSSSLE